MNNAAWREELVSIGADVAFDEPLGPKVSFRIGGPADAFVKVKSADQLAAVLALADRRQIPVLVLGGGTNVLIGDGGVRGIVLRMAGALASVELSSPVDGVGRATIGAGALNAAVVAQALDLGLVGLEFLGTIPGTFGGALIMNAGAHGGEIAPFVEEVELVDAERRVVWRPGHACGFAYRHSGFAAGEILTRAILSAKQGDAAQAREHLAKMREARRKTQPIGEPNAGSIFKNPPGDYAGRLIEAAGLKGTRVGAARISELHANFIVNAGGARAREVVELAELAQARVKEKFSVELEWEVKRLGDFGV
ncbi:MAG: UDP-N-acetylmuramate dehydrogenase [Myxococcota bacterium]